MTVKQQLKNMLKGLPENCSIEDVQYRLYVIDKVRRGLQAADKGEIVTQEHMRKRVKRWLTKSSGHV